MKTKEQIEKAIQTLKDEMSIAHERIDDEESFIKRCEDKIAIMEWILTNEKI